MREKFFQIVSIVMDTPREEINESSTPDSLENWDSLTHLNLILALEEEFGVHFSDDQIPRMSSVGIIIETVAQLGQRGQS